MSYPFYRRGNEWHAPSILPSDLVVEVSGISCYLHKFPLSSRCGKLVRALEDPMNTEGVIHLTLEDCPGGVDAFLMAAAFSYGAKIELTPKNIIVVCCVAEYLEMSEKFGEGNLLSRAEDFLHCVTLRSWTDCIWAVRSVELAIPDAETLRLVGRCFHAISTMACTDPSLFGWPLLMYGSSQSPGGSILWNGISTGARLRCSISDWWFEDVSNLGVAMFRRLVETMSKRGIRAENIAGVLAYYMRKHLPGLDRWSIHRHRRHHHSAGLLIPVAPCGLVEQRALLESLEGFLPARKGRSYVRFLLGLLRITRIIDASSSCKDSLEKRIGAQLHLATLDGLLIPIFVDSNQLYDTDVVERMIGHFMSSQDQNVAPFSPSSSCDDPAEMPPPSAPASRVVRLIDDYLAEVAPDENLDPENMSSLAKAIPESLRSLHDGLYRALDIYLKAHPWLTLEKRERLCSAINCGRLSIDACAHASHNERMPIRVVLQVLHFEQLLMRKAILGGDPATAASPPDGGNDFAGQFLQREGWVSVVSGNQVLRVDMEHTASRVRELEQQFGSIKQEISNATLPPPPLRAAPAASRRLGCLQARA